MSLAARLAGLEDIGVGATGVWRLAWTDADRATREWFTAQADTAGLEFGRDPAGNLWARPDGPGPWWAVGSHLDSVRGGGRFDGPLGVAAGFEVAAQASLPVAVISFADEEGARFNTPTFGSKALAGALDTATVLTRTDDAGVALAEAMCADGVDPDGLSGAPSQLKTLAGFIELHIDQTTELADAQAPIGVVTALASRTRLEVELTGQADHAGTTPPAQRRDALGAAARVIVAAQDAGAEIGAVTVTSSRILVEPNATTTIAGHVRLWIDARSGELERIDRWLAIVRGLVAELAAASRVEIGVTVASRSPGQAFAPEVIAALQRAGTELTGRPLPETICFAGHDAGVLAARIPAAMVLVRNPTGISHAPEESVALDDAELGVRVIGRALRELA